MKEITKENLNNIESQYLNNTAPHRNHFHSDRHMSKYKVKVTIQLKS